MRARATRVLHLQRLPRPFGGPFLRRGCPRGLALPCPPAGPAARAVEEGRGGARTSPARPLAQPPGCPHFLPLPACSGRPHARPAAPSPIDPLSPPRLPLRPRQDNRGHRAFAYRVSLTAKKWVPEGRDRAPAARHPHEGHSRVPCHADPWALPSPASPALLSGPLASKTKTNPRPPPCLPEEREGARRREEPRQIRDGLSPHRGLNVADTLKKSPWAIF